MPLGDSREAQEFVLAPSATYPALFRKAHHEPTLSHTELFALLLQLLEKTFHVQSPQQNKNQNHQNQKKPRRNDDEPRAQAIPKAPFSQRVMCWPKG